MPKQQDYQVVNTGSTKLTNRSSCCRSKTPLALAFNAPMSSVAETSNLPLASASPPLAASKFEVWNDSANFPLRCPLLLTEALLNIAAIREGHMIRKNRNDYLQRHHRFKRCFNNNSYFSNSRQQFSLSGRTTRVWQFSTTYLLRRKTKKRKSTGRDRRWKYCWTATLSSRYLWA